MIHRAVRGARLRKRGHDYPQGRQKDQEIAPEHRSQSNETPTRPQAWSQLRVTSVPGVPAEAVETSGPGAHPTGAMLMPRFRSRRFRRLCVALLVMLNLGGGPMAWAHLAGPMTSASTTTVGAFVATEHCAQHSSPDSTNPKAGHHGELPCCSSQANCHCGCPSASLAAPVLKSVELRFALSEVASFDGLLKPPATPPHDLFRPPIR